MKASRILTSRGEGKFNEILKALRGEERRILFSKYKLQKVGKRILNMEERRKAQTAALWAMISEEENDDAADDLLRSWLRDCKGPLLGAFLECFGISHQGGITEDDDWKDKIRKGDIAVGIRKLKEGFDPTDAWIYLTFLDLPEVEACPELASLVPEAPA